MADNKFTCDGCGRIIVMQLPIIIGQRKFCNTCANEYNKKEKIKNERK